MRFCLLLAAVLSTASALAGDTLYARTVLKRLCSKECFGRGYLKDGLVNAEKYIVGEVRKWGALPGFENEYTSAFHHPVNTFPDRLVLKINGKRMRPGLDFIPHPGSLPKKGRYRLLRADSTHFYSRDSSLSIEIKKKLTFSVAGKTLDHAKIELDRAKFSGDPSRISICMDTKLAEKFESRNIACYLNGTSASDSMLVFTAHYDHLGGIGRHTWFPGANDNASGVSMLLNLIRHYSQNPPRYKTVFVFFAAEEAGLLGSLHYTKNPPVALNKIRFLINLDLLGTGEEGIMVVNGAIHNSEFALLERINAEQGLVPAIKKRGKAANSDHYWFSEAGVPAFFIYTLGGRTAYHDVADTEKGLPFTEYTDIFRLITGFCAAL